MTRRKYLLDTNICIFYFKNKYHIPEKIESVGIENCYISEITVAELLYGAAVGKNPRNRDEISSLVKVFDVLPIYDCLEVFAETKALLREQGNLIDNFDLLIGSTAIINQCVMVTENTKHLERIPNLQIENWIDRE